MKRLGYIRDRIRPLFPDRPHAEPRIGAEVELLALDAATRAVAPLATALLPAVVAHSESRGWRRTRSEKGAPRFTTASGGAITFEPGGQIEYATPPFLTPRALLTDLAATVPPLIETAAYRGIELLAAGIDPFNRPELAPLQAPSERYCAMDAYFASIGPAGRRMMRQTASVQLNVDVVHDTALQWRVLNALAPSLVAIFANSGVYAGRPTGFVSYRSETWRRLDPTRTGLWYDEGDPVGGYAARALAAPLMLERDADGYAYFDGGDDVLDEHLTTLFPEVRPRGYFEVRSMDAVAPALYPAAVLMVAALVWDRAALDAADSLLGAPDARRLEHAGQVGLMDTGQASVAAELVAIARDAVGRLGDDWCDPRDAEAAFAFFEDYTLRGRSPHDDHAPAGARAATA